MKSIGLTTLFLMVLCLNILVNVSFGQRVKDDIEIKSEPVGVKTDPPYPSPPAPTNESPPIYESPKSEPTQSDQDSGRTETNSSIEPTVNAPNKMNPPRTIFKNDVETQRRRTKQKEEIERRQREARRRNKKDKDHYYRNCPNYDPYGDCGSYIEDNSDQALPIDPFIYFDQNDLAFSIFSQYLESDPSKYLPYFQTPLSSVNSPLYTVGFVEAQVDIPFITPFWTFYYEPDLGNFFIDFSKLNQNNLANTGSTKFDRLILRAIDKKTVKKLGKYFDYNEKLRPVVVENISSFALDRIYTFNISYLPQGKYELMLLSRTGTTVTLEFKIK